MKKDSPRKSTPAQRTGHHGFRPIAPKPAPPGGDDRFQLVPHSIATSSSSSRPQYHDQYPKLDSGLEEQAAQIHLQQHQHAQHQHEDPQDSVSTELRLGSGGGSSAIQQIMVPPMGAGSLEHLKEAYATCAQPVALTEGDDRNQMLWSNQAFADAQAQGSLGSPVPVFTFQVDSPGPGRVVLWAFLKDVVVQDCQRVLPMFL